MDEQKRKVQEHWARETCGIRYGDSSNEAEAFQEIRDFRYSTESCLGPFARFPEGRDKKLLEIGVGAGSDFSSWVAAGADATGVDLTVEACEITRRHVEARDLQDQPHRVLVADAERLPFPSDHFEMVYSWGVLHHSPDTRTAFREAQRVLQPGGTIRAMVYHTRSWTGLLLWLRYGLLTGKPSRSIGSVMADHFESPGTKAYTCQEFEKLMRMQGFTDVKVQTRLSTSDLLAQRPSERYQGAVYRVIFALWPRWLIRMLGDRWGAFLLTEAKKPTA